MWLGNGEYTLIKHTWLGVSAWILLFFSLPTAAQITWGYEYSAVVGAEFRSGCQLPDGSYILVSRFSGVLLQRLDSSGNLLWTRDHFNVEGDYPRGIALTRDAGFIIAGRTRLPEQDIFDEEALVLKFDSSGDLEWQKAYGVDGSDAWDIASCVEQTSDGGYIVAGTSQSFGMGGVWVMRLDPAGNILWQKQYPGSSVGPPWSIKQSNDGGYIVGGTGPDQYGYIVTLGVLRLDQQGDIVWQRTYRTADGASDGGLIQPVPDGGFLVAGGNICYCDYITDGWIAKLDADGNILWEKQYGGPHREAITSVAQTNEEGFVLGGNSYFNGWIMVVDSSGNPLWQKYIDTFLADFWVSARETIDGGYVLAQSSSTGIDVFKLRSDGTMDAACDFIEDTDFVAQDTHAVVWDPPGIAVDTWAIARDTHMEPVEKTFTQQLLCTSGPYVTQYPFRLNSPFRLRLIGKNFQPDVQVFIGGDTEPWRRVKFKSEGELLLKGAGLKAKFPRGVKVTMRIRNSDGGETYTYYTRP